MRRKLEMPSAAYWDLFPISAAHPELFHRYGLLACDDPATLSELIIRMARKWELGFKPKRGRAAKISNEFSKAESRNLGYFFLVENYVKQKACKHSEAFHRIALGKLFPALRATVRVSRGRYDAGEKLFRREFGTMIESDQLTFIADCAKKVDPKHLAGGFRKKF